MHVTLHAQSSTSLHWEEGRPTKIIFNVAGFFKREAPDDTLVLIPCVYIHILFLAFPELKLIIQLFIQNEAQSKTKAITQPTSLQTTTPSPTTTIGNNLSDEAKEDLQTFSQPFKKTLALYKLKEWLRAAKISVQYSIMPDKSAAVSKPRLPDARVYFAQQKTLFWIFLQGKERELQNGLNDVKLAILHSWPSDQTSSKPPQKPNNVPKAKRPLK